MFRILQKYKFLVKWLGLEPISGKNWKNQLHAMCYVLVAFSCALMSSGVLISDISDNNVREAADSANAAFGFVMIFTYGMSMLINYHRRISLLAEMNDMVNESMYRIDFYTRIVCLNAYFYFYSKGFC